MKYLITGGAGFIGSNFISYILRNYSDACVICLDKLTYAGNVNNFIGFENRRFVFEYADICDRSRVFEIIEKHRPDYIVNFAAESHVDRSIADPSPFVTTNIVGTANLLDAARYYEISRFHQVSTDEVYGDVESPCLSREEDMLFPSSPYSASKASADLLCLSYYKTFGLVITVSRCSNNFGPMQFPEKLIPLSLCNILDNKPIGLYGDGMQCRDWIYTEDHCKAIDLILSGGSAGQIYNVGAERTYTNIEAVSLLCNILSSPLNIEYIADRPGHDRRYALDCTRIKSELGWRVETDFEKGMERTVKWYLSNLEWLESIKNNSYIEANNKYK